MSLIEVVGQRQSVNEALYSIWIRETRLQQLSEGARTGAQRSHDHLLGFGKAEALGCRADVRAQFSTIERRQEDHLAWVDLRAVP